MLLHKSNADYKKKVTEICENNRIIRRDFKENINRPQTLNDNKSSHVLQSSELKSCDPEKYN